MLVAVLPTRRVSPMLTILTNLRNKSCTRIGLGSVSVNPFRSFQPRYFHSQHVHRQQSEPVNVGGEEADEIEVQDVDIQEKQYVKKIRLRNKSVVELKKMLFAVVHVGGKQYKVVKGDLLTVNRIPVDVGTQISLDKVLLVGGKAFTAIGRPLVANAKVLATVEQQTRSAPVIVFKMKRRKGYRRWKTFSALVSTLRIDDVIYDVDQAQVVREERVVAVE